MRIPLLITTLALSATLSGCIVAPPPRPYYGQAYGEPVAVAPPPPQAEYVGAPPVAGQIWINGFWNWTGSRHEWVGGHWDTPRPGHTWVPHQWQQEGNGWRLHGGHWSAEPGRGEQRGWR